MGSAKKRTIRLNPVSNYLASTMCTFRSNRVYSALKAVKHVSTAGEKDLECFVVLVSAYLTSSHGYFPPISNSIGVLAPRVKTHPVTDRRQLRCQKDEF